MVKKKSTTKELKAQIRGLREQLFREQNISNALRQIIGEKELALNITTSKLNQLGEELGEQRLEALEKKVPQKLDKKKEDKGGQ